MSNFTPEEIRKRADAMRAKRADPQFAAKAAAGSRTPEERRRRSELMRRRQAEGFSPRNSDVKRSQKLVAELLASETPQIETRPGRFDTVLPRRRDHYVVPELNPDLFPFSDPEGED